MAKPRIRKLKVYQAQLGFFDSVVATPNQAEALKAWGTHQDLFASGDAQVTEDPAAEKAALAHPGTPLQRPVGTKDPFELQPVGTPGEAPAGRRRLAKAKRPPAKRDRSRLDAAEAALRELDDAWEGEAADLGRQQEDLDERRAAAEKAHAAALEAAKSEVSKARAAYRAAAR